MTHNNGEQQQQAVCRGGNAVSVWHLDVEGLPAYYIRMEGKYMSVADREIVLDFYRNTIAAHHAFATLYDLSEGLPGFASHVAPFASFCNSIRSKTKGRLQFTVVVCPNVLYRNFLSMILHMAPTHAPFYVVETLDEAWKVLANSGKGKKQWDPKDDKQLDLAKVSSEDGDGVVLRGQQTSLTPPGVM